jgi:hypothetical protein
MPEAPEKAKNRLNQGQRDRPKKQIFLRVYKQLTYTEDDFSGALR